MAPLTHSSVPWPAPAKLNLFLHILGRRADGYHELQTAFQFIDLCDELRFEPRTDGRIVRVDGPEGVPAEEDLVVRAARCLREATHANHRMAGSKPAALPEHKERLASNQKVGGSNPFWSTQGGVSISLHKHIPMQAGLGGGSSDAATTLVALNGIWNLGLSMDELAQLGLQLGADVPVFVRGQAAWAEGVGERLQPIEPPEVVYLVIHPDCAVSTREIFQAPELTRNSQPITLRAAFAADFWRETRNDCEPVVRARYSQVAAALDWLNRHAPARLTGTGACVFAAIEDERRAYELAKKLPAQWQSFVVRGRNRSPLLDRLQRER